jgi:hypothetical protein
MSYGDEEYSRIRIRDLAHKVAELENERQDMMERINGLRRTIDELQREQFTVGSIIERTPNCDYALQILEMYPTPNGQYIVVQGSPTIKRVED